MCLRVAVVVGCGDGGCGDVLLIVDCCVLFVCLYVVDVACCLIVHYVCCSLLFEVCW